MSATHEQIRETLHSIVCDALQLEADDLPVNRPFYQVATSSLALVDAFQKVGERFGVRPSLRQVFDQHNTIDKLAAYLLVLIEEARQAPAPEPVSVVPGAGYTRCPLSAAQRQLVFLSSFGPEASSAFNEVLAVSLSGALDQDRLQAAFQNLIDRHEALRARLARGGEALVIAAEVQATLTTRDLRAEPDSRIALRELLNEEAATPFDLERALLRGRLVSVDEGLSVLVLTGHSLIVDRPALHALLGELSALYSGESLSAVSGRLADALVDRSTEADRAWWRSQLAERPLTELPTDLVRPAHKTYKGQRVVVALEGAGGDGFVPFMALSAAMIARWSGSGELLIGTSSSDWRASRTVCANHTNALPLRLTVDESQTLGTWTRSVRDALFDVIDHAAWPFAALVADLNPPRDQSRSPIFTVSIDREVWGVPSGGLAWSPLATPSPRARYDLHLRVVEGPGFSQLQCDFSTDLWEPARIRRWLATLQAAWQSHRATPELPLSALEAMPADAQAALLDAQRGPVEPRKDNDTLWRLVRAQAERTPDAVAVIHSGERHTYRQLLEGASRVATALATSGVGAGDRVGVCTSRSVHMLQSVLGILSLGAAFVPLDPEYPPSRIQFIAEDAKLAAILTTEAAALSASCQVITVTDHLPAGTMGDASSADAEAYVIYTSGSTGRPKGVSVPHRAASNLVHWARGTFSADELAGVLFSTSLCFDVSIFEIFSALASGGALIIAENAVGVSQLPDADAIRLVSTVPSVMREALRLADLPASVHTVVLAGEALPRDLVDLVYERGPGVKRVLNAYGPTEATVYASVAELPQEGQGAPSIGYPLTNVATYVLDAQLRPVERGTIGELCLGGTGVASGYLNRPELTEAAFCADPFTPGGRLYRTGDQVRLRADGQLDFLGRRDHQLKLHGFRIELGEIDATLRGQSGVRDSLTVVRDDDSGRRLVSYVVADGDGTGLRAALGETLPRYMVPAAIVMLDEIPRLPSGKPDRTALPAPSQRRSGREEAAYAPPKMGMEQVLSEIWTELLELDHVGREDDFFALGGDSLMLGPMMISVERRVGVRLTLAELFAASTLKGLAAHLETLRQTQADGHRVRRHLPRTGPDVDEQFERLKKDAVLDPSWQVTAPPPSPPRFDKVLITGVTGFVGAHTFWELLEQTAAHFTCLVRASDEDAAMGRIQATMEKYGLWDEAYRPRIRPLPGDLASPELGLEPSLFRSLAVDIDAILHMAAQVNFIYPYEALKRINVDGVRQIIGLAFAERPTPLHYVSTAAVWPMGRHRRFLETDPIDQRVRLNLGYDESKWVAEQLLVEAQRRGLPASIYRPGEVSGHSESGRIVLDHFMFAILKGSVQLGGAPRVLGHVDMAPVDYVAKAIAELVQRPELMGRTFHLNNPFSGTPDELYRVLREDYGYQFDILPMEEWLDFVMTTPDLRGNALYPYTAVLGEFQEENLEFPVYDTQDAQAALECKGVVCPPVDAKLLHTYLDWFLEVGFLPRPEARAK